MARNITAVRFCEGCEEVHLARWQERGWQCLSCGVCEPVTGAVLDPMGEDIRKGDRFTAYRALGSGEFIVKQVVHADGIASVLYSLIGDEHINAYAFNEYEALDTLVRG